MIEPKKMLNTQAEITTTNQDCARLRFTGIFLPVCLTLVGDSLHLINVKMAKSIVLHN